MKHLLLLVLLLSLCSPARADYLGSWKIDDALTFSAQTSSSTGAATDADSAPSYRVYEDETGTAIITGTMATLDATNTDGFYSEQITLSTANGLEKGKSYTIRIAATVGGVTGATTHNFQIEAEVDSNTVSPTVAAGVVDIAGDSNAADNIAAAYNGTGYSDPRNDPGRRTWFVDADDDGDGDTGTRAAPFDSVDAADSHADVQDGDIVIMLPGEDTTRATLTKRLHVIGANYGTSLIHVSHAAGALTIADSGTIIEGVFVQNDGDGPAVSVNTGLHGVAIINCDMDSQAGANISAPNTVGVLIRGCSLAGAADVIDLTGAVGAVVENCTIGGTGGASTSANYSVIKCEDGAQAIVRNCDVTIARSNAASGRYAAVTASDAVGTPCAVACQNLRISLAQSNGAATGGLYAYAGSADGTQPADMMIVGGSVILTQGGSGAAKHVDASVSGSDVRVEGSNSTASDVLGAANVQFVDAQIADLDGRLTAARAGYLDNINNAALASVPTFPANFAALGINASGHVSRVTLADTVTALTEDVSGTVSPFLVSKEHTWRFDRASQVTAPQLIQEASGFDDLLLEMDFSGAMSANASISSIDSVTITDETGKTEPTVVSSALSADRKKVHITTDGASATAFSSGYTYNVTVTTTDSQTLVRKGRLVVQ